MNPSTPQSLRLFFALWPDDATRNALQQLQGSISGRLVPYDNLHLTLNFLGPQPASLLPGLRDMLEQLPPLPLSLTLDRIGYFTKNRIAWAGMHRVPEALQALQQTLQQGLRQRDIVCDEREKFKPHLTLARDASLPPDMVFAPIAWQASQVTLVQSVAQSGGPLYRVLAARSLEQASRTPNEASGDSPLVL